VSTWVVLYERTAGESLDEAHRYATAVLVRCHQRGDMLQDGVYDLTYSNAAQDVRDRVAEVAV
jgi:hypothetical protein